MERGLKRNIILITSMIVISVLLFGVGHSLIARAASAFPEGSTIGGVNVGGKTSEEAITLLLTEIEKWKSEDQLVVTAGEKHVIIPYELLKIDINSTVDNLESLMDQPWYLFFKKSESQQIPLQVDLTLLEDLANELGKMITLDQAEQLIETNASYLGEHELILIADEASAEKEVIADAEWDIPQEYMFIDEMVEALNEKTISTSSPFSFLDEVANHVNHFDENEGSFVASMLYSLALQTNLNLVDRHSQGKVPSYTHSGIEVRVSKTENKDFILTNPGPSKYQIRVSQDGSNIKMSLLSMNHATTYDYKIENETEVDYRTITRFNNDLLPGHSQVIQNGEVGKRVEVYRVSLDASGNEVLKELISRDFYLPIPKIVLKSPHSEAEIETEEHVDTGSQLAQLQDMLLSRKSQSGGENEEAEGAEENENLPQDFDLSSLTNGEELTEEQLGQIFMLLILASMLESGEADSEMTGAETEDLVEAPIDEEDQGN